MFQGWTLLSARFLQASTLARSQATAPHPPGYSAIPRQSAGERPETLCFQQAPRRCPSWVRDHPGHNWVQGTQGD